MEHVIGAFEAKAQHLGARLASFDRRLNQAATAAGVGLVP